MLPSDFLRVRFGTFWWFVRVFVPCYGEILVMRPWFCFWVCFRQFVQRAFWDVLVVCEGSFLCSPQCHGGILVMHCWSCFVFVLGQFMELRRHILRGVLGHFGGL